MKVLTFSPNVPRSLSPAKKATTPPTRSRSPCRLDNSVAAVLIASNAAVSTVIPLIEPRAVFMFTMKDLTFSPNVPRSLSPAKNAATPPTRSRLLCNSERLVAAILILSNVT